MLLDTTLKMFWELWSSDVYAYILILYILQVGCAIALIIAGRLIGAPKK
mgnify:CR=1 FL=1